MKDLKPTLNDSQLSAVTTTEGALLVIAGAGSGKTRTIEYRVVHLIDSGAKPESILLLTFTRKAAHEMLTRASRHDVRCSRVDGGTFHSFAFRTLRRYGDAIGLAKNFSILDESDAEDALARCHGKVSDETGPRKFPKKSTVRAIVSATVNRGMKLAEVVEREYPHFQEHVPVLEKIRRRYVEYKIAKNYLDYDDLLVYCRILLQKDDVRKKLSDHYTYVMVDEYQDTNRLQGDIAYELARERGNIMVVGDDAQSIYGFRGASHENIMEFPKRFPSCRIIKLEDNYRSSQPILDLANAVLGNMTSKYSKCLRAVRTGGGDRPRLMLFKDPYEEAGSIAVSIRERRENGQQLKDMAVLFRSAYISIPLQAELGKLGIPFQVFGGIKFYETAHVKDLLAHLRVLINVKDELSWHRALTLIGGVGPKTADRMIDHIVKARGIEDAVRALRAECATTAKHGPALKRLADALHKAAPFTLGLPARIRTVFDYYQPIMKEKFDDWHLRTQDIDALEQIAGRYESLDLFLADFSIEPPERSVAAVEGKARDEEYPLTLSTIHSAKGLEWPTVYLLGMAEGLLPISFALDRDDELEEEQRLFYVAVTRAKETLSMSVHHEGTRGGLFQFNRLSRFIDQPNVLATIDQEIEPYDTPHVDDADFGGSRAPSYRRGKKEDLLRQVLDSFL